MNAPGLFTTVACVALRMLILPLLIVCQQPNAAEAAAPTLATGMNIVNPMRANEAARTALIGQLRANGVHLVRCGITDDAAGIAFAKSLYAAGIKVDLILSPQYAADAPSVPYRPAEYPGMWGGHPLSAADPSLSKAAFQSLIGKLDAAGVVLAGLELGNEINWAGFNPEFPLPGEGKVFNLAELSSDPEGRKIAVGYLQYLKILAALKQARDASSLNRGTPIISAGLSPAGPARTDPPGGRREDAVTINATLQFLRAHGLNNDVDAYGIHIYPWQKPATARAEAIASQDVTECGLAGGKPCWITEWGFDNTDVSCPVNDRTRTALVRETMRIFRNLAAAGRVSAVIYFSWDNDPWAKQTGPGTVYRCGSLTEAGRAALTP
jgi:Glycosyl hydrolase catalytic core